MEWAGKMSISAKVGAPVVVDGYAIPRRMSFRSEGSGGSLEQESPSVVAHFEVVDGSPQCTEFHLTTAKGARGIRTSDLSLFNIESLTEQVFLSHASPVNEQPVRIGDGIDMETRDRIRASGAIHQASQTSRLREIARIYLGHVGNAPRSHVATALGVTDRHASRLISKARDQGLIPKRDATADELDSARTALAKPSANERTMSLEEAKAWRDSRRSTAATRTPDESDI